MISRAKLRNEFKGIGDEIGRFPLDRLKIPLAERKNGITKAV